MGNSIVSGLSTKQTEQQAERKGNEAFEKAKAVGMTDTQAAQAATDEMLSMLPPDKRRHLLIDNDGKRLSINFAGKNGKVDRNQGGLTMSLAGDDFRSRHASLVDFISDEGLWGNNQMLGLATGLLDKRAAYYSYDSIAKRGQQSFAEGEHRGFVNALKTGRRTYNVDLVNKPIPQTPNVPRSPSKVHDWLSRSEGLRAELYGVGTIPASTAAVTGAIWNVPNGNFINSFRAGSKIVSSENLLNGSRYVFDAKSGMLDVTTTSTMSSRLQLVSGSLAAAKVAPFLSFAGTTLEYGAFAFVGDSQLSISKGKATLSDFAVDATLDLSKSVVAGAVGGGVGILAAGWAGAKAGAFAGSIAPGVGTVAGLFGGFAVGALTAYAIEQSYELNDSRAYFKKWWNN